MSMYVLGFAELSKVGNTVGACFVSVLRDLKSVSSSPFGGGVGIERGTFVSRFVITSLGILLGLGTVVTRAETYSVDLAVASNAPVVRTMCLDASGVLILANVDSPCGCSIVDLYRLHHPEIADVQVLYLSGLVDSASTTADPQAEIITRDEFETLIAQPVRDYLISSGLVNSVYCIITTAGMPYRIEDTDPAFADVVKPAGSNPWLTVENRYRVNAASVESELTALFQIDPGLTSTSQMPINGRVVNPYQGYSSGIRSWEDSRDILARRETLRWTYMWRVSKSPKIEGEFDIGGFSASNRIMSPADMYLVARLDGPRAEGEYPIFAVKAMLDRAAAVSDPAYEHFVGYNAATSAAVIDESSCAADEFAYTQVYNFPPQYDFLNFADHPTPPGADEFGNTFDEGNHYVRAFNWLVGLEPPAGETVLEPIGVGLGGWALWDDTCSIMNGSFLPSGTGLIGLLTYGRNGGDGRPASYLLTSGPEGGPLFSCVPGAVFSSLESFNAVTMFTDAPRSQAKIAEFIEMGGSAAVGHSFEPEVGATIQGEFLLRNLLRDEDGDGIGDLSLVEAAFTAMPYLSWSEIVIGDPLMRLRTGPGGLVQTEEFSSDVDGDCFVGFLDIVVILNAYNSSIGDPEYNPAADLDQDGFVGFLDIVLVLNDYNTQCGDTISQEGDDQGEVPGGRLENEQLDWLGVQEVAEALG
ncbi:MAG: hypothetical protein KAV00_11485 [Phycisphaerae bacterium]|nr:hypothetical protein [Phycisphaerae bacterium]